MFTTLSFITVLASRMYEFMGVVLIVLLPFLLYLKRNAKLMNLLVWFFAIMSLWVMLFFNKLIT